MLAKNIKLFNFSGLSFFSSGEIQGNSTTIESEKTCMLGMLLKKIYI